MGIFNTRARQIFLYCFVMLCFFNVFYFYYEMNSIILEPHLHYRVIKTDLNCYHSVEDDVLPSIDNFNFDPRDKFIFFHETSCHGGLTSMQSCAIESAARLHSNRQIIVLFSSPVSEIMLTKSSIARLLAFKNVRVARIHINEFSKGSPIESFLKKRLSTSMYWMEHVKEILKILTLYKYGGIYLDTDGIAVRNLDSLPDNWVVSEHYGTLATGAMAFSKKGEGANITKAVLRYLSDNYDPRSWTGNVASAIQTILEQLCPGIVESCGTCYGIDIQLPQYFYPISYNDRLKYFTNGTIENLEGPQYMHHTWESVSDELHIEEGSPYAKLAKQYCPTMFSIYSKYWGRQLAKEKYRL